MANEMSQGGRLLELLADRATHGLTAAEAEELELLLRAEPGADPDAFDLAAAAVHLTSPVPLEPLPAGLEARLEARAEEFISSSSHLVRGRFPAEGEASRGSGLLQRLGWYAAAACLAAAVAGWWPALRTVPAPEPPEELGSGLTGEALRRFELSRVVHAEDALRLAWTATEDPTATGAGGELLWSGSLQKGFMRFSGLKPNDPSKYQYQLWIFDETRDERYPIDGGVFDVLQEEALVPIDARLEVNRPTLFAVTVERPGGVVVSGRERIALVAAVG